LSARDEHVLEEAAEAIARESGAGVEVVVGDTSREGGADQIVEHAIRQLGHIDILVASTGSTPGGRIEEIPDSEWLDGLESKFMGYVRICRAVLPHMSGRGQGSIVLVVGNAGLKPSPWEVAPAATNAAGIALATALADQFASAGVRINTVNPGPVNTSRWEGTIAGFADARASTPEEAQDALVRSLPIGRPSAPEEIAPLIAFLASPAAGYMTGAHIVIDGGQRKALMDL
jgi:3-oxoacyl-[acyl-carrier protein] reductase